MSNIWRCIIHIPHGVLAGVGLIVCPAVGFGWLILIIRYQYLEDRTIDDKSYLDMRGYMVGFVLGLLGYGVVKAL